LKVTAIITFPQNATIPAKWRQYRW